MICLIANPCVCGGTRRQIVLQIAVIGRDFRGAGSSASIGSRQDVQMPVIALSIASTVIAATTIMRQPYCR
jgi:hypothetical protein